MIILGVLLDLKVMGINNAMKCKIVNPHMYQDDLASTRTHRAAKALCHAMAVPYHMQNYSRLFFCFFLKTVGQNLKCDVTKNCTIGVKGLKLASNN